jgi:TIR domain-containing protein
MKVFLSHIAEEGPLAAAMKRTLEEAVDDFEVFVSGVDIQLGQAWLDALDRAFDNSRAVLVLCSPRSIIRPWVNFESGGGWGRRVQVIPICHAGLTKRDLPHPLSMFQALTLTRGPYGGEDLIRRLVGALGCTLRPAADVAALARDLSNVADADRVLGKKVGIVRTAGQAQWPQGQYGSIFDLLQGRLPERLGRAWPLEFIDDSEQLRLDRISEFRGLVIGNPWRARFEPATIDAIRQFVFDGGRALLLGFELGDRHHNGNLSELARQFGIEPVTDIVGPASATEKPWYVPVDFEIGSGKPDPHPFTSGLTAVRLANVQTLRVEPGGNEWLRVGANVVFRPRRDKTIYASDGTLTAGKQDFEPNNAAYWCPVAVQAPPSLCGRGGVHAIGTWDLFGDQGAFLENKDNSTLVERLLDWLSGVE